MIEVRRNPERLRDYYGEVDEIVAAGASVHLEQLDENGFYLIVEDGKRHLHVTIRSKSGRAKVVTTVYEDIKRNSDE